MLLSHCQDMDLAALPTGVAMGNPGHLIEETTATVSLDLKDNKRHKNRYI